MVQQKLEKRELKRTNIPEDHDDAWVKQSKYDPAFTIAQMSDDEDGPTDDNNTQSKYFVSRAPVYRSNTVSTSLQRPSIVQVLKRLTFL